MPLRSAFSSRPSSMAPSATSSKRNSIASINSEAGTNGRDSFNVDLGLAQLVGYFSDPELVLAVDEAELHADKGYLGGWAGGYGGGYGKKRGLSEEERFWLTRQCLERFLRATKGNVKEATQRLMATLVWRRSFGIDELGNEEVVREEASRGKHYYLSTDNSGNLIHYMCPTSIDTKSSEANIRHAVWFAEVAASMFTDAESERVTMLVDLASGSSKKPSLSTSRAALNIVQQHYPDRLAVAYFKNLPGVFQAFVPIITQFMDPATVAKLRVDIDPIEDGTVRVEKLHTSWGGDIEFQPTFPAYFDKLNEQHKRVSAARFAAWKRLGGALGEDNAKIIAEAAT